MQACACGLAYPSQAPSRIRRFLPAARRSLRDHQTLPSSRPRGRRPGDGMNFKLAGAQRPRDGLEAMSGEREQLLHVARFIVNTGYARLSTHNWSASLRLQRRGQRGTAMPCTWRRPMRGLRSSVATKSGADCRARAHRARDDGDELNAACYRTSAWGDHSLMSRIFPTRSIFNRQRWVDQVRILMLVKRQSEIEDVFEGGANSAATSIERCSSRSITRSRSAGLMSPNGRAPRDGKISLVSRAMISSAWWGFHFMAFLLCQVSANRSRVSVGLAALVAPPCRRSTCFLSRASQPVAVTSPDSARA